MSECQTPDGLALSITPDYQKRIGLGDTLAASGDDIAPLMARALAKVAFMPFAYLVDKWRWDVHAGKTKPADFDKAWWELREKYQGIERPAPMAADGFDAGAKYHWRPIRRTRATSALPCCSSSSTARCAARPVTWGR